MRNILLTISYDGTDFCGWQRQDDKSGGQAERTVQGELEKALEKLHKQKILLYGSGRTDSGVHALGQAANFFSPIDSIPTSNYIRALNCLLPQDIRIMNAEEKSPDFNARFSATSRSYRYFISFSDSVPASSSRYVWNVKNYSPNIERLNNYASCLRGEIDCASFAASGDMTLSPNFSTLQQNNSTVNLYIIIDKRQKNNGFSCFVVDFSAINAILYNEA